MGLNRQDKATVIAEMSELIAQSSAIVIAEYRGLTVEAITKLRADARKQGVQLRVVKNTLVRRAVAGTPFEGLSDKFVGPLIYSLSADPVAAAKVLSTFAKKNDKLVIKGGAMANYVMDVAAVEQLASMPSREELLAKLMATMNEPIAKFVRTLNRADRQVRPHPQRSACSLRSHCGCLPRCPGEGCCLIRFKQNQFLNITQRYGVKNGPDQ